MLLFFSAIMLFRKSFAAKQRWKKDIVAAAAAAERTRRLTGPGLNFDRRRPLVYFTEEWLAGLQPFSSMFRMDDTLEADIVALFEAEDEAEGAAWLKNLGRYRCVECKRER